MYGVFPQSPSVARMSPLGLAGQSDKRGLPQDQHWQATNRAVSQIASDCLRHCWHPSACSAPECYRLRHSTSTTARHLQPSRPTHAEYERSNLVENAQDRGGHRRSCRSLEGQVVPHRPSRLGSYHVSQNLETKISTHRSAHPVSAGSKIGHGPQRETYSSAP
ncbi:hypothetical protein D3C80_910060 [compost metagenome]